MGQPWPLFLFIFGLFKQTVQFLQHINVKNVTSIQYTAPGFEPTFFSSTKSRRRLDKDKKELKFSPKLEHLAGDYQASLHFYFV